MNVCQGGFSIPLFYLRDKGRTRHGTWHGAFLTSIPPPYWFKRRSDAVKYGWNFYFRVAVNRDARSIFSAFAIFRQVKSEGIRLWDSIKLIAGRDIPIIFARFSCDNPWSLRALARPSIIFHAVSSVILSRMMAYHHQLVRGAKRNYSYVFEVGA